MSALAWLFGLGALSIAFPFLFHLIRRTPKGNTEFSSLMFLKPSPPTLTRRSRLENILLLLLRCAAILLLAFAFMRPFLRDGTQIPLASIPGRNVAILLDNSASMKRGELWKDAVAETKNLVSSLPKQDSIALYSFGSEAKSQIAFSQTDEPTANRVSISSAVDSLEPTWEKSNLGIALATVADQLSIANDEDQAISPAQIIVVTDFQKSSSLDALQSSEWPSNVKVKVIPVASEVNNASIEILASKEESDSVRVRIRNGEQSKVDQFYVNWQGEEDRTSEVAQYVKPGSSHISKLPSLPATGASSIELRGADCEFDNQFYFVPRQKIEHQILYIGEDLPDDAEGMLYYLDKALGDTESRTVTIKSMDEFGHELPALVLVNQVLDDQQKRAVEKYIDEGVAVLFVLDSEDSAESTESFTGATVSNEIVRKRKYSLLGEIDFQHPIFTIFNSPRFNDFTKIKFWEHVRFSLSDDAQVIARFDDESPAIWINRDDSNGDVICVSFGWSPEKSQLALSPKFVLLMNMILEFAIDRPDRIRGCFVNDRLPLDPDFEQVSVVRPDKQEVKLDSGTKFFTETDLPGIYEVRDQGKTVQLFAVNVSPAESSTSMMAVEQLEALGVITGEQVTSEEKAEQLQTLKDSQLESQQKLWKWAIVLALILLVIETMLAGRKNRRGVLADEIAAPVA